MNSGNTLSPHPHIVILATHWLGDTFWALQIYPYLKRRYPTAMISVVLRPSNRWLAEIWVPSAQVFTSANLISDRHREGNPNPVAIWREARRLSRCLGPVDLLCDLTGTAGSGLYCLALKARRTSGLCAWPFIRGIYHSGRAAGEFQGHLALRSWWALAPLFANETDWPGEAEMLSPRFPTKITDEMNGDQTRRRLVMFPGAGWRQKRWPLERFCEAAKLLTADGWQVKMLFAREEQALRRRAEKLTTPPVTLRTTDGEALLRELMGAGAVIANDSGPAHLAAALDIPTVAVYGPTNPVVCGPLGRSVRIVQSICSDLPGGVWHHCHNKPATACPGECWQSITAATIVGALDELIGKEACSAGAEG